VIKALGGSNIGWLLKFLCAKRNVSPATLGRNHGSLFLSEELEESQLLKSPK
jgi:hypothetical protein